MASCHTFLECKGRGWNNWSLEILITVVMPKCDDFSFKKMVFSFFIVLKLLQPVHNLLLSKNSMPTMHYMFDKWWNMLHFFCLNVLLLPSPSSLFEVLSDSPTGSFAFQHPCIPLTAALTCFTRLWVRELSPSKFERRMTVLCFRHAWLTAVLRQCLKNV